MVTDIVDPGFNFNNNPLGNSSDAGSLATRNNIGSQALSTFGVGRTNATLGYGGLVLSASSDAVSVLIRALQDDRRFDLLSRPQVMTLDNQPAFVQVGSRVPRITSSQITVNGTINNTVLENVGILLGVTPRVSPEGLIVMEIDAEKSKVGDEQDGIPISINANGDVIRSPQIDTITAQTTVSARNGQTVILGGLITKDRATISRRVPLLGDVPILGGAFRYDSTDEMRNELLIIMTPYIVRDEADVEMVKQRESRRLSWCLADVVEVHGDVGLLAGKHYKKLPQQKLWPLRDHMLLKKWGIKKVYYPDFDPTATGNLPAPFDPASGMHVPPPGPGYFGGADWQTGSPTWRNEVINGQSMPAPNGAMPMQLPNGATQLPNGTIRMPDGTIVVPDQPQPVEPAVRPIDPPPPSSEPMPMPMPPLPAPTSRVPFDGQVLPANHQVQTDAAAHAAPPAPPVPPADALRHQPHDLSAPAANQLRFVPPATDGVTQASVGWPLQQQPRFQQAYHQPVGQTQYHVEHAHRPWQSPNLRPNQLRQPAPQSDPRYAQPVNYAQPLPASGW